MPKIFKLFFWTAGGFLGLVALVVLAGIFLPARHRVARQVRLMAAPEPVWALVTDHAHDPTWRTQLKATDRLDDRHGHPVWQDTFINGQLVAYATTESVPGQRLVRVIVDQKFFGGTWTYELRPEGPGTLLRITEDGWVSLPFRVVARYVFGHATTVEQYLRDVVRHFHEGAVPEPA